MVEGMWVGKRMSAEELERVKNFGGRERTCQQRWLIAQAKVMINEG